MRGSPLLLLAVPVLLAALLPGQEPARWFREPAISPDGEHIAFTWRGDLYLVNSGGGRARPLSVTEARESAPVWSPDGAWIAFASDRAGHDDVYLMPGEGGRARRLTRHSADDRPSAFTADGGRVLFTSARGPSASSARMPTRRLPETWSVALGGGRDRRVQSWPMEEISVDPAHGHWVYQDRPGIEDAFRKHHVSSVTRDIWVYDPRSGRHDRLVARRGEDRDPVLAPDGRTLYWLSERGASQNVHRASFDPETLALGTVEVVTAFTTHPVRSLSIAGDGTLAFAWHGGIYRKLEDGEAERVAIEVAVDPGGRTPKRSIETKGATEMTVSPSGQEVAFVLRGEVFVAAVEGGETRRVTTSPEAERWVDFGPKGRRLVYASERGGSWNLWMARLVEKVDRRFIDATRIVEEPLLVGRRVLFQPRFSPDGDKVAFLEDRRTLKVLDLATRDETVVLPAERTFSYADGDQHFAWAPDGRHLVVEFLPRGYWKSEVGLVPVAGGVEPIPVTRSGFRDGSPRFAADAGAIYWVSDRHGPQSAANTGPTQGDVYAAFLTRKSWDRFRLSEAEWKLLEADEKEAKKKQEKSDEEEEDTDEKAPPIEIEPDGLTERQARLTIHSSWLADALLLDEGKKLVYLARFEKGHDLWITDLRSRETKVLAKLGAAGGSLHPAKDKDRFWLLSGGVIRKVRLKDGKREKVDFEAPLVIDHAAERRAMFAHVVRTVRAKFYDPDLHGRKWTELAGAYAPFVDDIGPAADFADFLSELLGELNASHTGARARTPTPRAARTGHLGLFLEPAPDGPGLVVDEIVAGGPADRVHLEIAAGHLVEMIEGVRITPEVDHHALLVGREGTRVRLQMRDPETGRRYTQVLRAIGAGAERELLYRRHVRRLRAMTERLSGGRIGYVHVEGMNDASFRVVIEEVLGHHVNHEALIVDTRWNGGGDLVDDLSRFLTGERYMEFRDRAGRLVGSEPQRQWTRPAACLAGPGNYSDAHCFAYAFQALDIGPVVGAPVPGTCTFVWWERLQEPGLVYGIPNLAVTDAEGAVLENLELQPDVAVTVDPRLVVNGRDPVLEAAVVELLETLDR